MSLADIATVSAPLPPVWSFQLCYCTSNFLTRFFISPVLALCLHNLNLTFIKLLGFFLLLYCDLVPFYWLCSGTFFGMRSKLFWPCLWTFSQGCCFKAWDAVAFPMLWSFLRCPVDVFNLSCLLKSRGPHTASYSDTRWEICYSLGSGPCQLLCH